MKNGDEVQKQTCQNINELHSDFIFLPHLNFLGYFSLYSKRGMHRGEVGKQTCQIFMNCIFILFSYHTSKSSALSLYLERTMYQTSLDEPYGMAV